MMRYPFVAWILAFSLVAGLVIATVDFDPLYLVARSMLFMAWIGILVRWAPGTWEALKLRVIDPGAHLSLGIWISFSGSFALAVFAMAQKMLGYPEEMRRSPLILVIIAAQLLGAVMHLTSPGVVSGRVPTRNWLTVAMLLALGGAAAGVLLVMATNPT